MRKTLRLRPHNIPSIPSLKGMRLGAAIRPLNPVARRPRGAALALLLLRTHRRPLLPLVNLQRQLKPVRRRRVLRSGFRFRGRRLSRICLRMVRVRQRRSRPRGHLRRRLPRMVQEQGSLRTQRVFTMLEARGVRVPAAPVPAVAPAVRAGTMRRREIPLRWAIRLQRRSGGGRSCRLFLDRHRMNAKPKISPWRSFT